MNLRSRRLPSSVPFDPLGLIPEDIDREHPDLAPVIDPDIHPLEMEEFEEGHGAVPAVDPNMVALFTALAQAANPIGKLPKFSGSATDILPEEFIKKFNTYGRVNQLTEQRKLGVAGMQLSGVAETWYNDLPEDGPARTSWTEFGTALVARFTIPNADMNHFSVFTSRKQKKNESVEDYAEDLKKLIKNIRNRSMVPEAVQITTFINGLLPSLKRTMDYQGSVPGTLMEATLNAKRIEIANTNYFESVKSEGNRDRGQPSAASTPDSRKRRPDEAPVVVAAQVVAPPSSSVRPQRDLSRIICNRCKQPGHFADSCPTLKDVTCYKCQKTGHYASKCVNERVLTATAIAIPVKEERKDAIRVVSERSTLRPMMVGSAMSPVMFETTLPEGDFKTIVHIGDVRTTVVMDSGACRHCMSDSFYNRMDKNQYPLARSDLMLKNAEGEILNVLGTVTLPVEFNYHGVDSEHWKFYVIENLVDNVLVGREDIEQVILKNGIVIKKDANLVRTAEAVTVPAQSARMINLVSDKVTGVNQIVEPLAREKGQIARCMVNANSYNHVTSVMNASVNPIHLCAAEVVGRIETAVVKHESGFVTEDDLSSLTPVPSANVHGSRVNVIHSVPVSDGAIAAQMDARLTADQQKQLKDLLERYREVFSVNPKGPGMVTHVEHVIDTGDADPIKQRSYRTSRKEEEYIDREVDEMMLNGIIRPSVSPWSSPVVLVAKKDNTLRFCIDYRKLNSVTKKDSYPLPRIQDTLDVLNGAKYFSSLDFASGYWQIKVKEEDIGKTAFVCKRGLFEFVRMPFGLCNAPGTFQRAMDILLSGLNWKISLIYIDDILVFSPTFEQHLNDLESVLKRLLDVQFTVKLSKCFFGQGEVSYLGHLVGSQGIKPDPSKLKAVEEFPIPTNLTEVRSFLGLTTYYHRFVPSYSTVAEPLYRLQKKNVHFEWSADCQSAFERIKVLLVSSPTLRYPDFKREFVLMTDASDVGVGVVLSQTDHDGKEYVVGYASRALAKEERNYSTTEKECLAVLFGIKFFRSYIHGTHFTVITDHGSLTWLINLRDANGRLARWALQLQGLDYTIKHRPGREHGNADALSRNPIRMVTTRSKKRRAAPESVLPSGGEEAVSTFARQQIDVESDTETIVIPEEDEHKSSIPSHFEVEQLQESSSNGNWVAESTALFRAGQLQDQEYAAIIAYLKERSLPEDAKEASRIRVQASSFVMNEDLLYRVWSPTNTSQRLDVRKQLAVPSHLRQEVMVQYHDSYAGGHHGAHKTFMKIRDRLWWNTMFQDVELYCKSCLVCQRRKIPRRQREAALMGTPVAEYPFERVGVDVVGPLPQSLSGNKYIVVFTDSFTRWPEAFAVPEQKEETIAQLLVEEVVCRFGAPKYLLSDRGANFLSALCSKVYELLQINKVTTTSYHPQANGIVERFNGVLVEMLSMFSSDSDWDAYIPYVLSAYRSSYNSTIEETPYYMVFGRQMKLPTDTMLNIGEAYFTDHSDYADEMAYRLHEAHTRVKSRLQQVVDDREQKNAEMHNAKEFNVGDMVWLRAVTAVGTNNKLNENQWKGPYPVVERTSLVNYKLDIPLSTSGKPVHNVVHVDRLKQFYNPETTSAAGAAQKQ